MYRKAYKKIFRTYKKVFKDIYRNFNADKKEF